MRTLRRNQRWLWPFLFLGVALGAVLVSPSCDDRTQTDANDESARAFRIEQREQLIGGVRSLGAVGDYMLENSKIRVIVQDVGFSRAFGVFGGGVIDMDRRRPIERNDHSQASGGDLFGEMFPAFFLQALNPERVEVLEDGTRGGSAIVRVSGYAGDFLTLIKGLNAQLLAVFGARRDGELSSAVPCQFGRYDGNTCTQTAMNGMPMKRCEAPGGLVCSAQCAKIERKNGAGEVVGYNWKIPGTEITCNPGVYDPDTCVCVNNLAKTPTAVTDGVTVASELCPGVTGPFCDPGCPDNGFFTNTTGAQAACVRGRFNPASCQCDPVAESTDDLMCASYCPNGTEVPSLSFSVEYELAPDVNYLEVRVGLTNVSKNKAEFPEQALVNSLLGVPADESFPVPMGDVFLFSAGNSVFAPGAGFDLRRSLQAAYAKAPALPALPGIPADFLATTTSYGVSYGVLVAPSETNFAWKYKENYAAIGAVATQRSLLIPFSFSAFTGAFYATIPKELGPGESFSFTKYVIVGTGDVGSILDGVYELRNAKFGDNLALGKFAGIIVDESLRQPVDGAWVVVYKRRLADGTCTLAAGDLDENGNPAVDRFDIFSQYTTLNGGRFGGTLEAGCYLYRSLANHRVLSAPVPFEIAGDSTVFETIALAPTGRIDILVTNENGQAVPAKATVVGFYSAEDSGKDPYEFLFHTKAGVGAQVTDLIPDEPGAPGTRRFIEATGYTDSSGRLSLHVKPNSEALPYTIYISRGTEYDMEQVTDLVVAPNHSQKVSATVHRVVDTTGYVSADLHLHTIASIDSPSPQSRQVAALAGEGVEFVASTDHNFVTDLSVNIAVLGLTNFISSIVGLELTTLEGGHFNGYPLQYRPEEVLHGSFEWGGRPPQELFDELRSRAEYGPGKVIIQVNHPRDSILGYFDQYALSNLTTLPDLSTSLPGLGSPTGPAFLKYDEFGVQLKGDDALPISQYSDDFDALELFNGKRFTQIHAARAYDIADCDRAKYLDYLPPTQLCTPNLPADFVMPEAGTVLREDDGSVPFPGNVEDWFNLLNMGKHVTGVANSDSHSPFQEEPGFPRNFVRIDSDDPETIDPLKFVEGIQGARVTTTNGPFVELFVNDARIGDTIVDTDREVHVKVRIQAPNWISADTLVLYANGMEVERHHFDKTGVETIIETDLLLDRDAFIVAEVTGPDSMFPLVPPLEVPPLVLTDAIGALGAAFGLFGGPFDAIRPNEVRYTTPWAMTNPIWVDTDGDGFTPIGEAADRDGDTVPNWLDNCPDVANKAQTDDNDNGKGEACEVGGTGGAGGRPRTDSATEDLTVRQLLARQPGNRRDIRGIFEHFNHH